MRKRKNKAPVRRMRVQDAFSNELARLGFDTPNLLEGTQYSMARVGRDFMMLNSLYREHWIVRRIIATIPEDMTKNWIKITSQVKPDLLRRFDLELRRTQLISKITKGLKWGRLYGGAVAVMLVKGQGDDLSQPLNVDAIMPGDFAGLAVFDRWNGVYPSGDLETNIEDPEFGLPKFYNVADPETGVNVRVHHSRCLRFIGNDLPYWEEIAEQYWGGSVIESVFDELKKRDNVSWNIAQLTFMANVRVMKMKDLGQLLAATDVSSQKELYQTLQAQNMLLSNMGVQVMDAEDGMESHQYTFGGLADCYKNFIMDICGAAEIPATRLFGRSPEGMNATGESDLQNYYEMITKNQENTLRPILNKLLPVLCMSILGAVPDDLDYEFNPVRQPSDEDLVDLAKAGTENVIQAYNAGLVSQRTALLELKQQSERTGIWTNITDADIEAANDQVEQPGEMGGDMAAMMGGEGGNPQGGPEQANGGPSAGQGMPRMPQAKTPEVKTPEVKTPNPGADDSSPFKSPARDADSEEHWVTINGAHIKVDRLGTVLGGAGGKFDGQKLSAMLPKTSGAEEQLQDWSYGGNMANAKKLLLGRKAKNGGTVRCVRVHANQQMINRRIAPATVADILQNATKVYPGGTSRTTCFEKNHQRVVMDVDGNLVSVMYVWDRGRNHEAKPGNKRFS